VNCFENKTIFDDGSGSFDRTFAGGSEHLHLCGNF